MLIIAMPKSASTSLLDTLGKLHNIPADQVYFNKYIPPSNCKYIFKLHSDIRELTMTQVDQFDSQDSIFKQHIFPSNNNLELFQKSKKVVLLRNPYDVVASYHRTEKFFFQETNNDDFKTDKTIEEWIDRAEKLGIIDDLKKYSLWTQQKNTLTITYDELMKSPKNAINKIEVFFNLNVTTTKIELEKKRYTRLNKIGKIKNYIRYRIIYPLYSILFDAFAWSTKK
jgi:hypothetical protein